MVGGLIYRGTGGTFMYKGTDASTTDIEWGIKSIETNITTQFENYIWQGYSDSSSCTFNYSPTVSVEWDIKYPWKYDVDFGRGDVRTPRERLRDILRQRRAPAIHVRRQAINPIVEQREQRARETLRVFIGEQRFRQFQKNGFITIRAKSGLVYQIFPGSKTTKVYKDGEYVENLCVVMKGNFPPTDSIIMRFLMILNDETEFRKMAGRHHVSRHQRNLPIVDSRPLPEIYRELRKNVA